MKPKETRRGRPKGSGIDDSHYLREIAAMIADDPDLKPTTAIKKIGIHDPSSIRRLRDKFTAERENLLQEKTNSTAVRRCPKRPPPQFSESQAEARTLALNTPREAVKREKPETAAAKKKKRASSERKKTPKRKSTSAQPEFHPEEAAARVLAAGVRSASALFHLQLVLANQFIHFPMMQSALRQHCAFSDALLGFSGPQPTWKSNS